MRHERIHNIFSFDFIHPGIMCVCARLVFFLSFKFFALSVGTTYRLIVTQFSQMLAFCFAAKFERVCERFFFFSNTAHGTSFFFLVGRMYVCVWIFWVWFSYFFYCCWFFGAMRYFQSIQAFSPIFFLFVCNALQKDDGGAQQIQVCQPDILT